MSVDAPAVRKDLFDLIRMFGPANAGGPAQANTNPGANPQKPAELPPPPPPAAMEARNQAPEPQGVKVLPQGTPIEPTPDVANKVMKAPQGASPQQGPIELLPGDADPNLLPPEIRDSWMFRYQQAQRAAQYKQAEEQARWQNIVGGVGNIAQIISGGRPTYQQTAAHAGVPDEMKMGDLYKWKQDFDATRLAAENKQALAKAAEDLTKATGMDPAYARAIIASNPEKLAEVGAGRLNINDDEKERLRINTSLKEQGRPEIRPEIWHAMQQGEKLAIQQAQGQGTPGKGFTEALVADTKTAIGQADKARDQMTPTQEALRTIQDPNSKLWQGGFYGDPTIQGGAKMLSNLLGQDWSGITDAETLRSRVGQLVMDNAKAFGGQPSEGERQAIKDVIGADGRINRTALETIMRDNLRRQVQATLNAQTQIAASSKTFADDPRSQAYLEQARTRLGEVPDMTKEIFGEPVVQGLLANQTPEVIADFDKRYGRGMAAYVIAKRGAPNAGQT